MNQTQITLSPHSDGTWEMVIQDMETKKITMNVIEGEVAEALIKMAGALTPAR